MVVDVWLYLSGVSKMRPSGIGKLSGGAWFDTTSITLNNLLEVINMKIPASVPKSDELTECLRTDKVIADALNETNKCRTAYYEQKIMNALMNW